MPPVDLARALTLAQLCYGRVWHVQPCAAVGAGEGLAEALRWLADQLLPTTQPSREHSPQQTATATV